jgi:hypothetical protein
LRLLIADLFGRSDQNSVRSYFHVLKCVARHRAFDDFVVNKQLWQDELGVIQT